MEQWLCDLLSLYPDTGNWKARRRKVILHRWSDAMVRAAEQDARLGDGSALSRYDGEVAAIKAAIPSAGG